MAPPARARVLYIVAALSWITCVVFGFILVARHEGGAGEAGRAPQTWPEDSAIARDTSRANLVMLVHPHCPCSAASVTELEKLVARQSSRLAVHVLVVAPRGLRDDPKDSPTWNALARIPGIALTVDAGGREARRFGASTSGQVALFDARGTLVFQGGITASRGHEGDNDGITAIESLIGGAAPQPMTPVFGCALTTKESP